MKSHWLGWVGVTLSLCGAMACGKGHVIVASNVGIPTFVGLPSITNQPHLGVHGKRNANVEVWAINGSSDARLAPAADSLEWTGTLALQEGVNTVFLYAKSGDGKGERSTGYTVQLDTSPPNAPTVYAPDAVNVGSTGTVTTTISGTKDPDSSIVINGNTVVPNDGLTAWTATVTVGLGDNNYNITAVDAAGNVSTAVTVDIYGSTLSTPIVLSPNGYANIPANFNPNDKPFLTNNPNAEFIGSKQGNTDLYFLFNGGAAQDVGFSNSASWDYSFNLGADGTYLVGFQVKQVKQDGTTERSGTVHIKVMLKTTKPQKPVINSPTFPVADTGDSSITLLGTLPSPDSYLCVSSTPGGPCIAVSNNYGGGFTVPVPLGDAATQNSSTGDNPLYISARDAYGNISDEIVQTVYRITPPTVALIQPPANGDTANISGGSLAVQVSAAPNSGDNPTTHPAAAIQSVHVCLDTDCVNATGSSGNYTVNPNFDLSGFANGTVHTLTVTVSDSLSTPLQTVITKHLIYSDGSPIWLSDGNTAQTAQAPRSAFDSSGTLHVVWSDYCGQDSNCSVADPNTLQPPDIFYAKRDRNTGTWTAPKVVSMPVLSGDGTSLAPSIAVDNADNVHIAWYDNGTVAGKPSGFGVVHRVLSHTGTLGAPLAVGNPSSGVDDVEPSLAVDPTGTVHAAFTRHTTGTRFDIMYARYVSGAWTSPQQVTQDAATGTAEKPSLAGVPGGTAHVAWQECRGTACGTSTSNPNHDIYIREVTSATSLGFGPFLVSNSTADGDSIQPSLVVDANSVDWVFWRDTATQGSPNGPPHVSPSNIWLEQCISAGCQHNSLSIVSNDSSTAGNPNGGAEQPMAAIGPVVGGDQTIAVVWAQNNPAYSNLDIASKTAQVSGGYASLVGNASMRYVAQTASLSQQACVALDSSDAQDLYVVWNDSTTFGVANPSGVQQIFFQLQGP